MGNIPTRIAIKKAIETLREDSDDNDQATPKTIGSTNPDNNRPTFCVSLDPATPRPMREAHLATLHSITHMFCHALENEKTQPHNHHHRHHHNHHTHSSSRIRKFQNIAADLGLVEAVAFRFQETSDPEIKDAAMDALKWICLDNKDVCVCVITQNDLFQKLVRIIQGISASRFQTHEEHMLNESVMRLVNTVTRSLWSAHDMILRLFAKPMQAILHHTELPWSVRSQAVMFFCIASSNPEYTTRLKSSVRGLISVIMSSTTPSTPSIPSTPSTCTTTSPEVSPLSHDSARSWDVDVLPPDQIVETKTATAVLVASAIAISNICHVNEYHDLLPVHVTTQMLLGMLSAFDCSIAGKDFPAGSRRYFRDWTLAASLGKMGRSERHRRMLCEAGAMQVLSRALQSPASDPRLTANSMQIVLDLSKFISKTILVPCAPPAVSGTHQLLGNVLGLIVQRNDAYFKQQAFPFEERTVFETSLRACMTVENYLVRINEFSSCSQECFLIAAVLIGRLESRLGRPIIRSSTIHRLIITAAMIGAKTHDDLYLNNKCWAQIGGVDLYDLNNMEIAFLNSVAFDVHVSPQEYEACHKALSVFAQGAQLVSPRQAGISKMLCQSSGTMVAWPGVPYHVTSSPSHAPRLPVFGSTRSRSIDPDERFMLCLSA